MLGMVSAARHERTWSRALLGDRCRVCSKPMLGLSLSKRVAIMNRLRNSTLSSALSAKQQSPYSDMKQHHDGQHFAEGELARSAALALAGDQVVTLPVLKQDGKAIVACEHDIDGDSRTAPVQPGIAVAPAERQDWRVGEDGAGIGAYRLGHC